MTTRKATAEAMQTQIPSGNDNQKATAAAIKRRFPPGMTTRKAKAEAMQTQIPSGNVNQKDDGGSNANADSLRE